MMEEENNQPLNQTRFEEIREEEDEDRISKLPDCLLADIISRLPDTRDAIRTGTLSKRWKHLWTCVPNLTFLHLNESYPHASLDFVAYVDKTLTHRPQSKLNKFEVVALYEDGFESRINNWIRYAVNCNVEDLNLVLCNMNVITQFPLDQFVFINSCFTNLSLFGCAINPTGAISWIKLRSLSIWGENLDEDMIENILSGSPVLETLVLKNCYGYARLNITSKSVKNLVLSRYTHPRNPSFTEIIEINAPNVLSLKIQDNLFMRKLLLLNVSSLVEADFDYKLVLGLYDATAEEEMLKGFILNLRHVKDLKIGIHCHEVLDRLKAGGFLFPSNLKVLNVAS